LKLELDFRPEYGSNASVDPPAFVAYVNAYLDHRHLSSGIKSFKLAILCTDKWANNLASYPGCGWHEMDARLSDPMRFPHLQSFGLTFVHGFYKKGKRMGLWEDGGGLEHGAGQRLVEAIGDAFVDTRARGVDVDVELLYPDFGDAVEDQFFNFSERYRSEADFSV
jgi:hypothetical protein